MQWWLNTDHRAFSVDNALVLGRMDFSALPPDIWMVQWQEGAGEIERQDAHGHNLNGLRERFTDLTPYLGYFQQFLRLLPNVTTQQARQVQAQIMGEIYRFKRTAPFEGWATDDVTLNAMTMAALVAEDNVEWWGEPLPRFEAHKLMRGIAVRTFGLQKIQAAKIAELEALASVDEIIDYDVTAGWCNA